MAFDKTKLVPMSAQANSDSPRMWSYITEDAMTVVRAADYFLDAINLLNVNDLIFVVTASAGTPAPYFTYVNANDGTTIDVVDGLAIPTTDT